MEPSSKDRLKKKLKDKKNHRTGGTSSIPGLSGTDNDIFNMLNQVNQMLKQNPDMVKKVSKCVSSVFENKGLMESLVNEIKNNTEVQEDQVFESKPSTSSDDAVVK